MHFVHKVVKRSIFDVLMLQVIELFDGAVFSGSSAWKPVQTGIKLSTTSVLHIFTTLVASSDNRFLLTSRLNQDALENVFSQVRGKGDAHPSIVAFRHNMRSICLPQFMTVPKTAAYHPDTTPHLLELVHQPGQNLHEVNEIDEIALDTLVSATDIDFVGQNIVSYIAGWLVFKLKVVLKSCATCCSSMMGDQTSVVLIMLLYNCW